MRDKKLHVKIVLGGAAFLAVGITLIPTIPPVKYAAALCYIAEYNESVVALNKSHDEYFTVPSGGSFTNQEVSDYYHFYDCGQKTYGPFYSDTSFNSTCWGDCESETYKYHVTVTAPINGSCSGSHYACTSGASANNTDGGVGGSYTWNCNGSNGGSNASCSEPHCAASMGNSCTSSANSCGQTNTGTIQCNGTCSASTPANPANYGNACTSASNSCGMTNSGTITCGGSCSATTPSDSLCAVNGSCSVGHYACTSGTSANNADSGVGGSYTWNCNGSNGGSSASCSETHCSASMGNSCTSSANSCGMTNSGTITCGGSCSATMPSNGLCASGSFTNTPSCSIASGASGCSATITWTSSNVSSVYLTDCGNGHYATTGSGAQSSSVYIPYNSGCYRIHNTSDSGPILAEIGTASSACMGGNYWSSGQGKCVLTPTASISLSQSTIPYNQNVTVTWSSASVSSCTVTRSGVGTISTNPNSSTTIGPITTSTTLGIDCVNSEGVHATDSKTVTVSPAPTGGVTAAPVCQIAVGASSCSSTVSWSINGNLSGPEVDVKNPANSTAMFSNAASGTNVPYVYSGVGVFTWTSVSNGISLGGMTTTITCASGSWDGSLGKCVAVPTVSWNPSSNPTWGEGDPQSFGYASVNAVSCSYQNPIGSPVFSALNNSWSGLGYWGGWSARAACTNAAGTANGDISVTVTHNNSSIISSTIPEYIAPNASFSALVTMQNIGTKAWDAGATPHALCVAPGSQAVWGAQCVNVAGAIGPGASQVFNVPLTAPAVAGDYPLSFQMREAGLVNESGASSNNGTGGYYFGALASAPGSSALTPGDTSVPAGYVRVKAPTLSVAPTSITFPASVAGDPAVNATLNIWNIGGGTISSGVISGYNSVFSGAATYGAIGAGSSVPVTLSFTSVATGTFSTGLSLTSAGVSGSPATVPLLAAAIDMLTMDWGGLIDFGTTTPVSGSYKNIKITNNSTVTNAGTLSFTSSTSTFTCISNCSANLSKASSIIVRLRFLPMPMSADAAPVGYGGTASMSFPSVGKTLVSPLTGLAVPVRIRFNEK